MPANENSANWTASQAAWLTTIAAVWAQSPALAIAPADSGAAPAARFRLDPIALSAVNLDLAGFDDDRAGQPPPVDSTAAPAEEVNTGQDPTKPLTRFDVRLKFQDLSRDLSNFLLTFRLDVPFVLNEAGWQLALRFDAPLILNDVPSRDNPNGDTESGFADSLMQALLITPPFGEGKRWAAAVGTQVLFPTGSQDQFGSGKWQLAPMAAIRMGLPELSRGSFLALLVRDQFSIAGQDERGDIHDLIVQPVFNWQLSKFSFVTFSPEMRFDLERGGDAFVPFNMLVGTMLNPRTVVSVQFDVPIVDDYEQYEWQVEFRIGFFF